MSDDTTKTTQDTPKTTDATRAGAEAFRTYIYGLSDPRDGRIRYVGKTMRLRKRRNEYWNEGSDRPVAKWVRKLKKAGRTFDMRVLAVDWDGNDWKALERGYIAAYRSEGLADLNASRGGEGCGTHFIKSGPNSPIWHARYFIREVVRKSDRETPEGLAAAKKAEKNMARVDSAIESLAIRLKSRKLAHDSVNWGLAAKHPTQFMDWITYQLTQEAA